MTHPSGARPRATVAAARTDSTAPGRVVKVEPLPQEQRPSGAGMAERLTYWSTGSDGKPVVTGGRVFLPSGHRAPRGGWPVISWHHATVGLAPDCAPSIAGGKKGDTAFLAQWLQHGYAVVATDYAAMGSPPVQPELDGRTEAHNAVDMVRAARSANRSIGRRWIAVGHSEGGHAALFTAANATRFAPELDFRGTIALAPPSNFVEPATALGPATPDVPIPGTVAHIAVILAGLKAARPDFDLDGYLTSRGRSVIADAERLCSADLAQATKGIAVRSMFRKPLSTGDFSRTAHQVMDVPLKGYDRPLLIAHGTNDTTVPIALTAKLVADLKLRGADPDFRPYRGVDHGGILAASFPRDRAYAQRLFG
ncbi:lipase family protein [Actinomadura sp. NPDC000600]|uniref:alpha/beta hydrolase family protein n=1 Tax=Actinomadura sp. NPDC000600 TaxID=3154262 RepID=UPI0033937CEE